MIWSTPLVTEYESQYGPPQLAQLPMEITYFGSGICSYSRRSAGTSLSVTVPEMTTRSAWRGLAGSGITPSRMMSYRGEPTAAPISMAQQARPHWYIHSEYRRDWLNSQPSGFGTLPFSTRPTSYRSPADTAITAIEGHPCATRRRARARGSR